ncbi:hypothetical protein MRB53_015998 [Persea americana]|uniref:Uncharacterized protein n=1 Tax=Persea americana TaxID=3435 RepID=A0ACC2M140_PERAE|nr:hypothetical protein MRB53_015998 [Persea americana]
MEPSLPTKSPKPISPSPNAISSFLSSEPSLLLLYFPQIQAPSFISPSLNLFIIRQLQPITIYPSLSTNHLSSSSSLDRDLHLDLKEWKHEYEDYLVLHIYRTAEEVFAAKGVKPTLFPNLNTLALVEAASVKCLLFWGVGCQVQE